MTTVTRIGQSVGRYRLEQLLGRGGMAEVYRASDARLGRSVAVKLILPHHAVQADFRERFAREARLVAALDHPNILPVYDFGEEAETPFLVMPLLEGGTLADRMTGEPYPLAQVIAWAAQLGGALDAAHEAGILHRDVKPSNVLLGKDGRVVLADFGIAKSVEASTRLTSTGAVVGTPAYMAPELARGESAGRASDLYALAVMVYELLSGHPPFLGDSALAILHRHVTEPVPPVTRRVPALPAALDAVLARALAKEPGERPASCSAFAAELAAAAAGRDLSPGVAPTGAAAREAAPLAAATAPTVVTPAPGASTPSRGSYATGLPAGGGAAAEARGRRGRALAWMGGAALVLAAAVGVWLATGRDGGGGESAAGPEPLRREVETRGAGAKASGAGSGSPSAAEPASAVPLPGARGTGAPEAAPLSGDLPLASSPAAAVPEGASPRSVEPAAAGPVVPPGPLAAAVRIGERAAGMMRPSRRLGEKDFREVLDLIGQLPAAMPRSESQRLTFPAIEQFARGGLAWIAGDATTARRELAGAAGSAAQGPVPVPFPLLLLREGGPGMAPDWQLAFAFGDPRGDAVRLLAAARAAGTSSSAQAAYAEAVLARWEGRHAEAAQRLAREIEAPATRSISSIERAQLAQLEAEELAFTGDAAAAARAFDRALADAGGARGPLALEAGMVLSQRLGRRDLASGFLEVACAEGLKRACVETRPAAERKIAPFGRRRPRPGGGSGPGG